MDNNALALWNQFIESGKAEQINPVISRSWQRSRKYDVNHDYIEKTEVLNYHRLSEKLEERQQLIEASGPVMEELYSLLRGLGFMVVLADQEGYILKALIDEPFRRQASSLTLCEGANWSEKSKGTNAIGTSLVEGNAVKVLGYEHYVKENHTLACAAVPILGSNGQILGTLDVTGESKRGNERIFRMVRFSAKSIERELHMNNLYKTLDIYKAKYDGLFDLMQEGAVVVDEDGTVSEISRTAAKVLGLKDNECLGANIEELFNLNNMWVLDSSLGDTKEITISPKHGSALVNARARRLYGSGGEPGGMVAIVGPSPGVVQDQENKSVAAPSGNGNRARFSFSQIIGNSDYLQQVISICKRVARNNSTILISGETGTGKEMLAQAIHQASARSGGPFVAVNCAAIPSELIESELFGFEDGAFTGARKGGSLGKFEIANGGTIFLDEIGDMSARAQVSLLRVLQEKQLCRVGGRQNKPIDVRVIAATHRNLTEMVEEGTFRQDLFFRLNVVNVYIPPLRRRKGDIDLLVAFFMNKYKNIIGRPRLTISPEAMDVLSSYSWPGNVRELENAVEGLVNIVEEDIIKVEHLPKIMFEEKDVSVCNTTGMTLKEIEKAAIIQAIKEYSGSLSATAAKLDIGRSTLYRKLKEYEIDVERLMKS